MTAESKISSVLQHRLVTFGAAITVGALSFFCGHLCSRTFYLLQLVKAIHVISVISFMAGILYLPRLYVYHAGINYTSEAHQLLCTMERRLESYIVTPALFATVVSGCFIAPPFLLTPGNYWLHAKLLLFSLMAISYFVAIHHRLQFAKEKNQKRSKFFRIFNEVPTLLMIFIVLLVIMKPF